MQIGKYKLSLNDFYLSDACSDDLRFIFALLQNSQVPTLMSGLAQAS